MRGDKFKEAVKEGKAILGLFMKIPSPALVEVMGYAGFDFVILDMEHGPMSYESLEDMVRAADHVGIFPIVRITENNPGLILRALDTGVTGVEIPHVTTKDDAVRAVQAAKFTPMGGRGVCRFVRAARYSSLERSRFFKEANEKTVIIVHIEGVEGINNLESILTVDGLDVIFIGPYDLSESLGITGQVEHPLVVEKMDEVIKIAKKRGAVVGTFVDNAAAAKKWMKAGVQYISFSTDVGIFYETCRDIMKSVFQ